jgi:hypothetical protein
LLLHHHSLLLFFSHENYCLGHDMNPLLSRGQIYQWLEENNNDEPTALELKKVLDAYAASKPAQIIEEVGNAAKKNDQPAIVM